MVVKIVSAFIYLYSTDHLFAQDIASIVSDFKSNAQLVRSHLGTEDDCSRVLKENTRLQVDAEKALVTQDISLDDINQLKWVKTHAEALDKFIRTIGETRYVANFLKELDLTLVREQFNVQLNEVSAGKYCCQVFKYEVDDYTCLLAYKSCSNESYTIKAVLTVKNSTSKTEMGLITNSYRRLWSSSKPTSYKISSITCYYNGKNQFSLTNAD